MRKIGGGRGRGASSSRAVTPLPASLIHSLVAPSSVVSGPDEVEPLSAPLGPHATASLITAAGREHDLNCSSRRAASIRHLKRHLAPSTPFCRGGQRRKWEGVAARGGGGGTAKEKRRGRRGKRRRGKGARGQGRYQFKAGELDPQLARSSLGPPDVVTAWTASPSATTQPQCLVFSGLGFLYRWGKKERRGEMKSEILVLVEPTTSNLHCGVCSLTRSCFRRRTKNGKYQGSTAIALMTLRPQTSLHLHRRRANINMQLKYVLRVSVIPKGRNIITNCPLFKRLCWLASHQIRMHKRVISERNCFTFGLLLQRHINEVYIHQLKYDFPYRRT